MGWLLIPYGFAGTTGHLSGLVQKEEMQQSVYFCDPSVPPCPVRFYRGSLLSEWENNLIGSPRRRMYTIRRVVNNEPNRIVAEERLRAVSGNDSAPIQ